MTQRVRGEIDKGGDPAEKESRFVCDNCRAVWRIHELKYVFPGIPDLTERIEPGGIVPAGECPWCGALLYPAVNSTEIAATNHPKG